MKLLCPWCLGELPGKPGQVAKCRHCTSDIFWGGDEPFKTEEEALSASQATPDFEAATEAVIEPPPVPEKTQEDDFSDDAWLTSDSPWTPETLKWSPGVVSALAHFSGGWFHGNEIRGLSTCEANAIVEVTKSECCIQLSLSGLTTITPEVAEALAKHEGQLDLSGLTTLTSASLAERWVNRRVRLNIENITTITPEVAEALAKHEGQLDVSSLTTITPEVAEALAKCESGLLIFGLTSITADVAEALAKREGELSLWRLTTITPEVAEALAKCNGRLWLWGLTAITPEALKILRENHRIGLPSAFAEKP